MPKSQCGKTRCWWQVRQAVVLKHIFDQIKTNLAEIQLKKHQNVQKSHFLQKVPGVNGLNSLKKGITLAVECAVQTVFTFARAMVQII